ncbi:hypothetical protein HHK36_028892 [Tetracentron sinense]|uniref:MBD domain-containing protein n=1 Tax=Tetracentron sinense TaxID=13715 RepID=A0A834YG73_TETSI|nr:hypothetical protein HHK36_028892 [Tetracentron sinense]
MADAKSPDWLPAGWIVEVKERKKGGKYKCYIAPTTGCKFYSKRDVSHYLEDVKVNSCTPKQKKRSIDMHSTSSVVLENVTVDELPPGWIKETRVRKSDKKDSYYTDPVCGYVFRSKIEVFRYLETGEPGKRVAKPKTRSFDDVELIDGEMFLPAAAKRQKLAGSTTRRQLFNDQSSKSNKILENDLLKSTVREECIPHSKHFSDQWDESTDLSGLTLPKANGSKKMQGKKVSAENGFVSALAAEVLLEKQPLENGVEKPGNRNTRLGPRKSKGKKFLTLPLRASKRLAGLEAERAPELGISDRARRVAVRQSGKLEPSTAMDFALGSGAHSAFHQIDQLKGEPEAECEPHSSGSREVSLDEEPSNKHKKSIVDEAAPEDEGGELKTENKAVEKPDSPLIFPFGDSWPDPCLEFAIKTLTGAISVEDDLAIQDYFQKQLGTSQAQSNSSFTLPDFSLDSFCQTDLLFQFEAPKQPTSNQKLPMKSTFLPPGNVASPSSGENVLPTDEVNREYQR